MPDFPLLIIGSIVCYLHTIAALRCYFINFSQMSNFDQTALCLGGIL